MNYLKIGQKEVLFKAKLLDRDEWIEGLPFYTTNHGKNGANAVLQMQRMGEHGDIWMPGFLIEQDSLCEFTGKYDDNHKRIYTGDILHIKYENDVDFGLVVFNNDLGCYVVSYPGTMIIADSIEMVDFEFSNVTVLGNIYNVPNFFKDLKKGDK